MREIALSLFFSYLTLALFSQVSIDPSHAGRASEFENDELKRFKKTTTVFVLSKILDTETYQKILEESWTVTPFKVVHADDFNITNYLTGDYSIARLTGELKEIESNGRVTGVKLRTFVDFNLYNIEKIQKKLTKIPPHKKKKIEKVVNYFSIDVARFYLFYKNELYEIATNWSLDSLNSAVYNQHLFFNYSPGLLKNYFQKINKLLLEEKQYWMYEKGSENELAKLKSDTLYIPSYFSLQEAGIKKLDAKDGNEYVEKIFKNYDYSYQLVDDSVLSKKVMNGQEFYYLRYVRVHGERFLQVVNAKTGEIIYRDYLLGYKFYITDENIQALEQSINSKK